MKKTFALNLVLLFVLLTNCKNETPLTGGNIEQTAWELVQMPASLPEGTTFSLSFEAGTLFGQGPCNRYHATYNVSQSELQIFGGIGRTKIECPANGPLEQQYYNYLANAQTFGFKEEHLVIRTKEGDLVFKNIKFSGSLQ